MTDQEILTIREVAEYLRITEKTAYRLASSHQLPGFKVGGSWRFRHSEIVSWIDNEAKTSKKPKDEK